MTDTIFVGGKTYMVTRPEGSQSTPANYGTYASGGTDDKMNLVTNFSPALKNNMIKIYSLGGGRSYKAAVPGKFEASGSIEMHIQNASFLKYGFGTLSSATTATKTFDGVSITGTPTAALKTYMLSEADVLDSFSMDVTQISDFSTADVTHRYLGTKINQVSIKADTESPLTATYDWIAQKVTTTTASATDPTTTAFSDVPKMFYQGQLLIGSGDNGVGTGTLNTMTDATKAWATNQWQTNFVVIDSTGVAFPITANSATALTVSGTPTSGRFYITPLSSYTSAQVIQCNSVDITITHNLESYWSISNDTGRGIKYALEKQREYTLNLDLNFTNAEQLGRFYTGATTGTTPTTTSTYTPFMVVLDFKTATTDGDNYKAMRFIFDGVVFDETSLPVNPQDILKQTVTAFAKKAVCFQITSEAQ
jgi:hypothetical protein